MKNLPELLKNYQQKYHLSQYDMASKLQVSQPTYNNWVNGHMDISPKHHQTIADLLQIDLETLVSKDSKHKNTYEQVVELKDKYIQSLEEQNKFLKAENERFKSGGFLMGY